MSTAAISETQNNEPDYTCLQSDTNKEEIDKDNTDYDEIKMNKTLYMCVYILSVCYYGICLSLSGAIYVELRIQLDTESSTIAYIFSVRSISSIVGGISGAYIIDQYKETHKFFAFVVLCSGVSLSIIPLVKSVVLMYILWVPIGFAMGCAELSNSVYIFRLFPKKGGSRMLLLSIATYHFGKLSAPLIVQGSIELFGSYAASMWIFSFIALMYILIVPWLSTPPHDKLRALKREVIQQREKIEGGLALIKVNNEENMDLNELVTIIAERLKADKKYRNRQCIIITFLILCYALFSMIRNGYTTFITTYINEYIGMDDSIGIGRYLIVTFYIGQFMVALIGSAFKQLNPMKCVLVTFICFLIITTVYIIFGYEIYVIFIVFALAGLVGGLTYPFLYAWCELIRPLTGLLSCMFTLAYGCGVAIISAMVAQIIDRWGIRWYTVPLVILSAIACIICIVNCCIYIKYKQYERNILKKIENQVKNKNENSNIELSLNSNGYTHIGA
eukprot:366526_1